MYLPVVHRYMSQRELLRLAYYYFKKRIDSYSNADYTVYDPSSYINPSILQGKGYGCEFDILAYTTRRLCNQINLRKNLFKLRA